MDFEKAFPLRFWINLGRREDRRVETEGRLEEFGITAVRFAAVDAGRNREPNTSGGTPLARSGVGRSSHPETIAPEKEVRGYESAGDMRWHCRSGQGMPNYYLSNYL
jgi:hypothetical protein